MLRQKRKNFLSEDSKMVQAYNHKLTRSKYILSERQSTLCGDKPIRAVTFSMPFWKLNVSFSYN